MNGRYFFLVACLFCLMAIPGMNDHVSVADRIDSGQDSSVLGKAPIQRTVILQRVYLDGEMSEEKIEETIISMDDFWRKYDKWLLVDQNDEQLVFQTYVDDISPLLKGNGYFGIKSDGTITIFNGKPAKEQIIQSFYQIDLKKLETNKKSELQSGVKVVNKERYLKFLEVYKAYSTPASKTLQ